LEAYLKLTPQDLWTTDLDAFLEEWEASLREDEQMEATNKPRKKGAVIRTRKSIGKPSKRKDDDDDDDFEADYKPKKGKRENGEEAKARVAASKAKVAAAAAAFAASSDDEDPPARNRISLTNKGETGDEMVADGPSNNVENPPATSGPMKRKTAAKRKRCVQFVHSYVSAITHVSFFLPLSFFSFFPCSEEMATVDSDDDLDTRPVPKKLKTAGKQATMDGFLAAAASKPGTKPKAVAKKAAAPKGKKKAVGSEDEDSFPASDGGDSPLVAPPPKPRVARTAAVRKPTYVDVSDDEENAGPKGDDESFAMSE
jgi:DNA topoisomerase-2